MSKRDASTYFDSLVVPQELQPWFGQQPVQVKELVQVGLSLREIASWVDDLDTMLQPHTLVFPVNVVWPMGFSWLHCAGQHHWMLAQVRGARVANLELGPRLANDPT